MNTSLRQSLLARLGHFPQRVPLTPIFATEIDEGTYIRTPVTYRVEADEYVPAWLLTPKGAAPQGGWPAILAIHQHAGQYDLGKSELIGLVGDPQYAYGRELCQRGYASSTVPAYRQNTCTISHVLWTCLLGYQMLMRPAWA